MELSYSKLLSVCAAACPSKIVAMSDEYVHVLLRHKCVSAIREGKVTVVYNYIQFRPLLYTSAMFMDIDVQKSNTEIPEIFHALFAHYFEAKVGRGRSVEYSILPHAYVPSDISQNPYYMGARGRQSRLSGRTAASLNMYHGKSPTLLLTLIREASKQLTSSW